MAPVHFTFTTDSHLSVRKTRIGLLLLSNVAHQPTVVPFSRFVMQRSFSVRSGHSADGGNGAQVSIPEIQAEREGRPHSTQGLLDARRLSYRDPSQMGVAAQSVEGQPPPVATPVVATGLRSNLAIAQHTTETGDMKLGRCHFGYEGQIWRLDHRNSRSVVDLEPTSNFLFRGPTTRFEASDYGSDEGHQPRKAVHHNFVYPGIPEVHEEENSFTPSKREREASVSEGHGAFRFSTLNREQDQTPVPRVPVSGLVNKRNFQRVIANIAHNTSCTVSDLSHESPYSVNQRQSGHRVIVFSF